jgi:hypothetical protein
MTSILDQPGRVLDGKTHQQLTIESLVIVCESPMTQAERIKMLQEWREMGLLQWPAAEK